MSQPQSRLALGTICALAAVAVIVGTRRASSLRPSPNERILRGFRASRDSVPWQASIQRNQRYVCGGALIGRDVVVTAAHCVNKYGVNVTVRVGSIFRKQGGVVISARKCIYHRGYYAVPGNSYDIGLIFLSMSVKYSTSIQPLILPYSYAKIPIGEWARVTGWGTISYPTTHYPNILFGMNAEIIGNQTCRKLLPGYVKPAEDQICAYSGMIGKGVCKGDSGSPLVIGNYLIGVVSWGIPCARGVPDVYTQVSHYVRWIRKAYAKHGMYLQDMF